MWGKWTWWLALLGTLGLASLGSAYETYEPGELVPVYANKVGPFHNPSEAYSYYTLPFCKGHDVQDEVLNEHKKSTTLGIAFDGGRRELTGFRIPFKNDVGARDLCTVKPTEEDVRRLRDAVLNDWYFKLEVDGLPVIGNVGKVTGDDEDVGMLPALSATRPPTDLLLYTHLHFEMYYNGSHVVEVEVTSDPDLAVKIPPAGVDNMAPITFMYSVTWYESEVDVADRLTKYSIHSHAQHHLEIHWFSIINSCMIVLLLTAFLATLLLHILRRDLTRFQADVMEHGAVDEGDGGWKHIAGDVFRFPEHRTLFTSFIGTGYQLLTLCFCSICLGAFGSIHPTNRSAMMSAVVLLYALTAGIAAYQSSAYYRQLEGEKWARSILCTCVVFFGPVFIVFAVNNTICLAYGSIAALPAWAIAVLVVLWALVTLPLQLIGGFAGKNNHSEFYAPVRTNKYRRDIPALQPWHRRAVPQILMGGFLPFASIYIELHYIFASIWTHKVYTIYSILLVVFLILLVVTAFVTVSMTYFQLNGEDYRWWWRSFFVGGSLGFYLFGYSVVWFLQRGHMSGLLQTSVYFGYNALASYACFLAMGTVGFRASLTFVRAIYRAIKLD